MTENTEKQQRAKWYVLRIMSGQEKKVEQALQNELKAAGLQGSVKQILMPTEKVVQLKKGKKVTKERSYYPGYMLIEAEIGPELIQVIKSVNGVVGFLGSQDEPTPMREAEINRVLGKMDASDEVEETVDSPFSIGDPVKVNDGPFSGFSGVVEEVNEEKRKLRVIVKIFGRRTPLELNFLQVEKE